MSKCALIFFMALFAAGCGVTGGSLPYKASYFGTQHSTLDEAKAVRSSARAAALAEITPLSKPIVDRTLVVNVPTIAAIKAYRDAVDPPGLTKPAQGYRDFFDWEVRESVKFVATAISRRGLYKTVDVVDVDSTSSVPVSTVAKDFYFLKFNPQTLGMQPYFTSERTGQVIVASDSSAPSAGKLVQSVIDQVTTFAVGK